MKIRRLKKPALFFLQFFDAIHLSTATYIICLKQELIMVFETELNCHKEGEKKDVNWLKRCCNWR